MAWFECNSILDLYKRQDLQIMIHHIVAALQILISISRFFLVHWTTRCYTIMNYLLVLAILLKFNFEEIRLYLMAKCSTLWQGYVRLLKPVITVHVMNQ